MSSPKFLTVAILTVSDTRDETNDTSGDFLVNACEAFGHRVSEKIIVRDDIYDLRTHVSRWIADDSIDAIITTGGTGFMSRDSTPEALAPLFDKNVDGFGELFRAQSFTDIGTSTIQSRAFAGLANHTVIFCLPGSTGACKTGWEIIKPQLDSTNKPCNFVSHLKAKSR